MDFVLSFCIYCSSEFDLGERLPNSAEYATQMNHVTTREQESCLITALPDNFEVIIAEKCQNTNPMDTSLFGFRLAVRN